MPITPFLARSGRRLARLVCLAVVLSSGVTFGQSPEEIPEPYRSLPARLRARATEFPLVEPVVNGSGAVVRVTLNRQAEVFPNGQAFDAIRFRTPAEPERDLVWAFVAPEGWRHWYVLPVEGEMQGFRNWLDADRAYVGFEATTRNPVTLQTLPASNLRPDTEYLIWFSQQSHQPGEQTLQVILGFAPARNDPREWEAEAIAQALGLTTAPAEAQVAYLDSRGGRVLLDRRLFRADYAQDRIDDCLMTRRTTRSSGGYYVTMQTMIPPCGADGPLLSDVVAAYGPADLVLPGAQRVLFQEDTADEEIATTDLHYYDYFAFEVVAGETEPRVERVVAQAFDVSGVLPRSDGLTWEDAPIAGIDLRVFHADRKEVGRVAFWGDPNASLVAGELAPGTYRRLGAAGQEIERLVHEEGDRWTYVASYDDGAVFRTATLQGFRWEGALEDRHPDGSPKASAHYLGGRLHGSLKVWNASGQLVRDQMFVEGELQAPPSE